MNQLPPLSDDHAATISRLQALAREAGADHVAPVAAHPADTVSQSHAPVAAEVQLPADQPLPPFPAVESPQPLQAQAQDLASPLPPSSLATLVALRAAAEAAGQPPAQLLGDVRAGPQTTTSAPQPPLLDAAEFGFAAAPLPPPLPPHPEPLAAELLLPPPELPPEPEKDMLLPSLEPRRAAGDQGDAGQAAEEASPFPPPPLPESPPPPSLDSLGFAPYVTDQADRPLESKISNLSTTVGSTYVGGNSPAISGPHKKDVPLDLGAKQQAINAASTRDDLDEEQLDDPAESEAETASDKPSALDKLLFRPIDKLLLRYSEKVVQWPWVLLLCHFVAVAILLGAAWQPFVLQQDFSAILTADVQSSRNQVAYNDAFASKKDLNGRRLEEAYSPETDEIRLHVAGELVVGKREGRRLDSIPLFVQKQFVLAYTPLPGVTNTIFDSKVIMEIKSLERGIQDVLGYQRLCNQGALLDGQQPFCNPGLSFIPFAFANQVNVSKTGDGFSVLFDSSGADMLPVPAVLAYMETATDRGDRSRDPSLFFPKDYTIPPIGDSTDVPSPKALRSTFNFQIRSGFSGQPISAISQAVAQGTAFYERTIRESVYPYLTSAVKRCSYVRVFWGGDYILGYEVTQTLIADLLKAIASAVLVAAYTWLHTRSIIVSVVSLFTLLLTVPISYVLVPSASTTILDLTAIFLVIGAGEERVVFVVFDTFHRSRRLPTLEERVHHTLKQAGFGCFATSVTTSVGFFANLVSTLPALRKFGLFMGLCIMFSLIETMVVLIIVLVILAKRQERLGRKVLSLPEDAAPGPSPVGGVDSMVVEKQGQDKVDHFILRFLCTLERWPLTTSGITLLVVIICLIGSAVTFKLDQTVPSLFPKDSNQVAGQKCLSTFAPVSLPPGLVPKAHYCDPGNFLPTDVVSDKTCAMNWLRGSVNRNSSSLGQGTCWRSPTQGRGGSGFVDLGFSTEFCQDVTVSTRFARRGRLDASAAAAAAVGAIVPSAFPGKMVGLAGAPVLASLPPLAVESWETGSVQMLSFDRLPDILSAGPFPDSQTENPWRASTPRIRVCPNTPSTVCPDGTELQAQPELNCTTALCEYSCTANILCFLDTSPTVPSRWSLIGNFSLKTTGSSRRLHLASEEDLTHRGGLTIAPLRHLQGGVDIDTRYATRPIGVLVVFGIRSPRYTPVIGQQATTWSFDPLFQPANPWAQRAFLAMCSGFPPELRIFRVQCWILKFQKWRQASGQEFPSRDFDKDVVAWYRSDQYTGQLNLWMVNQKMRACRLEFSVNAEATLSAPATLAYMKQWDNFVGQRNQQATVSANRAWHYAAQWVSAQAQVAIVDSTIETIGIIAASGWGGILVFTGDPVLASLVLIAVVSNLICLTFFMTVILQWMFGPVEVIALVLFTGYCITFNLQIAANYSSAQAEDMDLLEAEQFARDRRRAYKERLKALAAAAKRAEEEENPEEAQDDHEVGTQRLDHHPEENEGEGQESNTEGEEGAELLDLPASEGLDGRALRTARARIAVLRVAQAQISAAVSTVLATVPLLFCTLSIFLKLGVVIIAVTVISTIYSLVSLPALLILMGPPPTPFYKRVVNAATDLVRRFTKRISEDEDEAGEEQPAEQDDQLQEPLVS